MKMPKILSVLLILALLFSLSACAAAGTGTAEPIVITDHANRTVEIHGTPERLVSGYYITTSLLIALGLEDQLVGIEAKAASRPIYALAAPELLELPNVGTAKEFNLEACIDLEPDLVILPLKLQSAAEQLDALGIPAICVNPEDDVRLAETVDMIAAATGTEKTAEKLLSYAKDALADLQDSLKDADASTVYLAGNASYLSTAGAAMYQNTLLENAGTVNAAASVTDTYWAEISYEQLLEWDPDCIVIVPAAAYTAEDLMNDEALSGLSAVQNGQVYAMPADYESWDSPVPSAFMGSLWIASRIHGDLYSEADYTETLKDFYKTFYDFDPAA
ncbi:MAG: ABC transporter substrate-binding protein [Clostridia bacterium]|nr:ABC transporter substrate-binding protein [Clostridia bacterium]